MMRKTMLATTTAGLIVSFLCSFGFAQTGSAKPFQVSSVSPIQNGTNIPPNTDISIVFDTAMDSTTINDSTFVAHGFFSGPHPGTISYTAATRTALLDPESDFLPGEVVTVILSNAVTDSAGNPLPGFVWNFTTIVAGGTGVLAAPILAAANVRPHGICAAFLNNDGFLDIVTANYGSGDISVLFGNGNGTFGAPMHYAAGVQVHAVSCSDVDGDGDLDCIVPLAEDKNVQVYLNDGSGSFSPSGPFSVGTYPTDVFLCDFDGDGNIDIAATNRSSNDFSILLGNGDGTFQPQATYVTNPAPFAIHGGDFDEDGDIDIAIAQRNPNKLNIFLNQGDGTFVPSQQPITGVKPLAVFAASLNAGDNFLDLVVPNSDSDNISVFTGIGDGTFAVATTYATSPGPVDITVLDIDGDGDLDAVTSNAGSDSVSVLFNDGNAIFDSLLSFTGGDSLAGICAGDFNGDGALDIAVSCFSADSIAVLLNFDDTIPPGPPQNLTANGSNPSPWVNIPLFGIDWVNPPDSSGIRKALYKLGAPPTSNFDTTGSMNGQPPDSAAATSEEGQMLYLWLQDLSLNVDYQNYATVELRYDSTPPSGSDASSPRYSTSLDFLVSWTAGTDSGGSAISGYDVRVKDGTGPWTPWLSNHPGLSATFTGADGHTYLFEAGARDSAGNVETFLDAAECTTTVDTTRPFVMSTYPADGDSNIPVNANISSAFSEQMDTTSMYNANFSIIGSGSGNHAFSIQYNHADSTAHLNPNVNFFSNETVTVTVRREVTDLAGNLMVSDKIWTFVTGAILDTLGPYTYSGNATPNPVEPVANLAITATVSDTALGDNIISGAEFFVDVPGLNGDGYPMSPRDSLWDEVSEEVVTRFNTQPLGWSAGDTHFIFIHGKDAPGNWGAYDTVMVNVVADDDTTGPSFSDFSPVTKEDTLPFNIECQIQDPAGVFDDSTGSGGQGIYLRWDNDGEIAIDAFEVTLSNTVGSFFRTDSLIPVQNAGVDFVYQVYAFDNDFDTQHPGDRTQDSSGIQQVTILDVRGPSTESVVATPNPTNGAALLALSGLVSDSLLGGSVIQTAEFFVDDTGAGGTGNSMLAADGLYDEISEAVVDTLDISGWQYGTSRWLYVHGMDSSGNWGRFDSVLVFVSSEEDTTSPFVISTSPDSGETGVSLNRNIFIAFSEPLDTASLDTSKFHITGTINPVYTYTLLYNEFNYTVLLDPAFIFAPMETVTVSIASSIIDTAGNGMAAPYQFFFSTGLSLDTTGPVVTTSSIYPDTTQGVHSCLVTGTISDATTGFSTIMAAELFIDSAGANGTGIPLFVSDGMWDEIIEDVHENIDVSALSLGDHWVYLHGYDAADNWGPFDSLLFVVTPDDDTLGPTFSDFLPDSAPDTTGFIISCVITDPSGVYDDSTGSGGQGVYLLWDNDGEIAITANEMKMSQAAGDTFITDFLIPQQNKDANFVYEVYAYDNDFDFNEPDDRTQGQSTIQSIVVYDARGPRTDYVTISPPSPPEGISQVVVYATISDSLSGLSPIDGAEAFLDSIGSTGSGFTMQPLDGAFDSILEVVLDTVAVSGWMAGDTHTFYVHGRDAYGNWGTYDSSSVYVIEYVDTIPPWIAFTSPDSGEIDVSLNSWIYVTFDEKVDPVTVTTEKILIDGDIAGTYAFWMSYNSTDSTLSINPYNDFAPYELITVYISSGIQDLSGNTMTSSYSWWFRTGAAPDTTPPIVDTMAVTPDTIITSTFTVLTAMISDNTEVSNGEYFLDAIGTNGTGYPVQPVDSFGMSSVDVFDTIAVDTMTFGLHVLYLHGIDGSGNWGNHDSVFFFIAGEDTIGPQFSITTGPSPAHIGDSILITAIPNEPLHQDSAVICSLTTSDGSLFSCVLNADSLSFNGTMSSVGFSSGICSLSISGFDLWSNRGTSFAAFSINPRGEFLPDRSVYAWPNPAKQNRIYFHYYVNQNATITVDIFNLEGKRIASLSGTGDGGNPAHLQTSNVIAWGISGVASDIYLFRLTATSMATGEEKSVIKKFAIVK